MKQIDTRYNEAVQQIKSAILQSQLEAAKAINRQMLALYYGIGKVSIQPLFWRFDR